MLAAFLKNYLSQPTHNRHLIPYAAFSVTILVIVVIGLFEASLNISVKTGVESRLHETADHIDAQMQEQLDKYRRDIRFLHETPPISGLVRAMKYNGIDPDSQNTYQQWAEQLQTTFVAFMEHNQEYDQIRIISGNEDGLELVRVERVLGKIQRVKASQLQSKKDRDYFSASLQLAEGELYMSQFSLNREFGQIEVPYRPTLRISIPIFINEHQRLGFLILNINAQPILDSLVLMAGNQFQLVMTDNDGYYLVSPNDREKFSRDLAPELQWQNSYQMEEAIAQDFTKVVRADDVSTVFYAYEKKVRVAGISEDGFLLIRVLAPERFASTVAMERRISVYVFLFAITVIILVFLMILARAMRRNNQLSAARALSAAIIKGSKNSIISTKPDGTIISWNHAAEVMFKYSESYALGQSIAKLALLDDIDILTCIQSVSVDNPLHEVDSVLESSHSKTYLSLSLSAIVGANNRFMGVAIIVRDQTIERQAEEKVKQINSELELKVASRTAELEKASKVKNAFISNISHEMRTPLNGIMGTLSLLRKDPLTENQLRYLEMTAVSVNSLAVLINDILDLSKIEAGKLDLDFKAFNPIELVESLTCSLAVKAQEKGLEVILDIADLRCQSITSDPHRFSQILTNLISNGIKFTDTGHIKVTAYCQPLDLNITRFTCSVADTGIGIAEANQSKLFHAFTQEDTEIASKYGGTGLGLSICRQLTHLLNGEISFESTKGVGSTFEFHIDLPTENCVLSSTPKLLENKRCLIVVPYSALEISATKLLKNYGASCLAKQEYIDWLDGNTAMPSQFPDYIFIDFTSPYLSLLDKHWQLITSFTPKVFVLRNSGQPIPLLEHLAVSSLNKPIQLSELTNKLCDRKEQKDALLPVFTKVADDSSHIDDKRKLAGANILIVDDNEINIEVASGMLAELPMNIFRAMNGQQALDVLQAKTKEGVQIHCILMDCQMPILDGYKTSEQIRSGIAGEENSHLPIIAMTANAMLGERKKCINAGMSDYITKPISLDLLVTVVIKWTLSVYQAGPVKEAMVETLTKPMIEKGDVVMWDKESALMRLMQNVKLFKQICRIFANKSPDQMRLLGEYIDKQDFDNISKQSHSLKGSTGDIGATELHGLYSQIEMQAKQQNLEQIVGLFEQTQTSYENFCISLQEFIDEEQS